jgi:hypothetical protein
MNNRYYLIDEEAILVPLSKPQGSRVYNTSVPSSIANARVLAMTHVLKDHVEFYSFITNAASTYLFIGKKNSEDVVREGEYLWKDLLTNQQMEWMDKTGVVILGAMIVTPTQSNPKSLHFIEYIDTFVRGHNVARRMIQEYEKTRKNLRLIPRDISCNITYWTKFFEIKTYWFDEEDEKNYYRDVLKDDLHTLSSWESHEVTLYNNNDNEEDSE